MTLRMPITLAKPADRPRSGTAAAAEPAPGARPVRQPIQRGTSGRGSVIHHDERAGWLGAPKWTAAAVPIAAMAKSGSAPPRDAVSAKSEYEDSYLIYIRVIIALLVIALLTTFGAHVSLSEAFLFRIGAPLLLVLIITLALRLNRYTRPSAIRFAPVGPAPLPPNDTPPAAATSLQVDEFIKMIIDSQEYCTRSSETIGQGNAARHLLRRGHVHRRTTATALTQVTATRCGSSGR